MLARLIEKGVPGDGEVPERRPSVRRAAWYLASAEVLARAARVSGRLVELRRGLVVQRSRSGEALLPLFARHGHRLRGRRPQPSR